jgi:hypothetical protein
MTYRLFLISVIFLKNLKLEIVNEDCNCQVEQILANMKLLKKQNYTLVNYISVIFIHPQVRQLFVLWQSSFGRWIVCPLIYTIWLITVCVLLAFFVWPFYCRKIMVMLLTLSWQIHDTHIIVDIFCSKKTSLLMRYCSGK